MYEGSDSQKVSTYFKAEWKTLLIVTISGIFYNFGLLAGPLFEGKLAQCLLDILNGNRVFADMAVLAFWYVAVISAVQIARYIKRLYVRRFANNTNRRMKQILYGNLVQKSKAELDEENIGSVLTKAISDVDACVEGMRKFTTEIFDTGVALAGYVALLIYYDWRLALLCLIFPPFSYLIAEKMKVVVQRTGAAYKESAARLSAATMDRVGNSLTYRVYGCEARRDSAYEKYLEDYERAAVRSQVWVSAMPPLYQVISMVSVLFILFFGSRRVGNGIWDIAAFTTFLSCFTKLSVKSSKAAKLFNAVQKAEVSWKRIKPLLKEEPENAETVRMRPETLEVSGLKADGVFEGLSFAARPGQIIGITGPVACGKSTLGKLFLCEKSYGGSIRFGGKELSGFPKEEQRGIVGYLGHDTELLSDTIENNICLGETLDVWRYLRAVCLDEEVSAMKEGVRTVVGSGGILLSGGQQQRLALARTLAHPRPVLVLDDPFSALDQETERQVFENLRELSKDSIVFLISHRLYLFPELDGVVWMEDGKASISSHEELMGTNAMYGELYKLQQEGAAENES
ncbi:MAG: ABC transporter ATP-binding protein [Eubacteriales bacterium]|nr:ABC transporter ATP-binding protein [Eubacteriales bacterium]